MINAVVLSARAKKDLRKVPDHIRKKLRTWISAVELLGLETVRKIPGFHDEPLHGNRHGQRSIRLNKAYRGFYSVRWDGRIEFVMIEEVNKHEY